MFFYFEFRSSGNNMNYKWSPAEVNQILFCNFKEPTKAIEELVTLEPCDLYGFERVTSGEQT